MKAFALTLCAGAFALSACTNTTTDQNLALGSLAGAAVGATVSNKDDRLQGALIGAAVGAGAGTLLGQANNNNGGQCYYADGKGGRYIARC